MRFFFIVGMLLFVSCFAECEVMEKDYDDTRLVAGIETNDKNQYRLMLVTSYAVRDIQIDAAVFNVFRDGLGPAGAAIYIRDKFGKEVKCDSSSGFYSSMGLSANLAIRGEKSVTLKPKVPFYTQWYELRTLLTGIDKFCTKAQINVFDFSQYKLRFLFSAADRTYGVQSDWYTFDKDFLKTIR